MSRAAALPRFRLPRSWPQLLAVLLVVGLVGAIAVEPTRQLLAQRDRIETMLAELNELERVNERLEDRITRLKDPDFVEQLAREQAGLVRPGEIPFVVMPPSREAQKAEQRRAEERQAEAQPPEPETSLIESFLNFLGL